MKNCSLCSTNLKFGNTPLFGSGKLNDGGVICTNCFKNLNRENPNVIFKLKNLTLADIQDLLKESSMENEKNIQKIEEIQAEIENLRLDNVSSFFGRKEIKELPNILTPSEHVDNIIQGTYNNRQGILVSTNKRLLFIDKGLMYGLKVEDFPLEKINSIQYETGLIMGKVKIHTAGNAAIIENVQKVYARKFAEFVRDKLLQPKESQSENEPQIDILGQIEKLSKLKESGILTEEEFVEHKKKLLNKI